MTYFSTSDQARAYERSAARGLAYEAQDRIDELRRVIPEAARVFAQLKELGHSGPWLDDAIKGVLDQISNITGECESDMDGLLCNFACVDTSELERIK